MNSNEENNGKEGVLPKQETSGSDADKAYDHNGNFEKDSESDDDDAIASGIPEGSDADTDE